MQRSLIIAGLVILAAAVPAVSQTSNPSITQPAMPNAHAAASPTLKPPPDYVIGPDDVVSVEFWRDKDLSTEAVVRPDGKISVPLLNDVAAAGLTPDQLRQALMIDARRFVEDPNITIVIKQINSRKVFITGQVEKPGSFPLKVPTTVVQLIAMAGGLREYADVKRIFIVRNDAGGQTTRPFNYSEVLNGKNLAQNIELKPGDTVIVP
jgi:polysaccharide export outer membrane protein